MRQEEQTMMEDEDENVAKEGKEENMESLLKYENVAKKDYKEEDFITTTTTTTTSTVAYKKGGWGARHTVVLLSSVGVTLMSMMRFCLPISIVSMVMSPAADHHHYLHNTTATLNTTAVTSTLVLNVSTTTTTTTSLHEWVDNGGGGGGVCPAPDGGDGYGTVDGSYDASITRFEWDEKEQGHLLGAFYYGYILTNVPGGRLAEKVGSKRVILLGMFLSSLMAVLSPLAANLSFGLFIGVRLVQGLAQGILLPAFNRCMVMWVPPYKRSKFTTFVYIGLELGIVLSMGVSGFLCSQPSLGGWAAVFYVFGGAGILWCAVWWLVASDSPLQNNRISTEEKHYLVSHCVVEPNQVSVPWGQLLRSLQFWVVTVMHVGYNWGYYTLASELPIYMANIQHFSITSNGIVSAMPYVMSSTVGLLFGVAMDRVTARGLLSVLAVRRLAMAVASYIPAAALVGMCLVGCNHVAAVAVMCVAVGTGGCAFCGLFSSYQDLSPNLAGTLFGIVNSIANVTGFLAPALAGVITFRSQTVWAWNSIFLLSASAYLLSGTFYICCITDQVQPFNDPAQGKGRPRSEEGGETGEEKHVQELLSPKPL